VVKPIGKRVLKTPTSSRDAATDFPKEAAIAAPVNDYDPLNTPTFSADDRLKKILDLLRTKKSALLDSADTYKIHPASIAIAVAWEFVENVNGFLSDMIWPISGQRGYGFAQFHRDTLKKSQPQLSNIDIDDVRRNSDAAIAATAKHIGDQRDIYKKESGGLDLSNWPEGLAWLFNTNSQYVSNAGQKHLEEVKSGKPVSLIVENDMAYWGLQHKANFSWLVPKTPLPNSTVTYTKAVRATYDAPRWDDERYDPRELFRSR
jgi:hypothetical protein